MPTNLGVLGTQELAPLFQATRGGYLKEDLKFGLHLPILTGFSKLSRYFSSENSQIHYTTSDFATFLYENKQNR